MTLVQPPAMVIHERPAESEADELLAFQRAMLWLRVAALAIIVSQGWLYEMVSPILVALPVGVVALTIAVQGRLLTADLSVTQLRRRATLLFLGDLFAVYAIGTAFTADASWIGYYFYPLMALEAALIAGLWAGLEVIVLSIVVYLAQLVLHIALGFSTELRSAIAAMSLIGMTGAFMVLYAHLAGRGRDHLRAMLSLTSALALHEDEAVAIHHLDRRLHAAIGARIRSVAVREPGGGFRILAWRTSEERTLTPGQLGRAFGDAAALASHLEAGEAVTVETDAWSVVTATLGLPEWAASVTLVPIVAEGRWVAVLPALWPTRTKPGRAQLSLLNGLAGQLGLVLARTELEQMRRSATVDPVTGLLNRRAIGAELEAFVARASRSEGHLAVLLLEVAEPDGAPDPSDATLLRLATAVRDVLRSGDVAGRHDDDRLLVIAAEADAPAAQALGRRIEEALGRPAGDGGRRLGIGIGAYPDDGPTAGDLVESADAALETATLRGPGGRPVRPEPVS